MSKSRLAPKYEDKILVLIKPKNADNKNAPNINVAAEKTLVCFVERSRSPLPIIFLNTRQLYYPCNAFYN